ncbi:leucine rich adaptor protein 1-like [Denticeps clupeoides]|uniref:Leucine rich adaptor protein 1 n=1 Tax=Denticeps clupeoides TaxID=299321 RepID=A0AAY4EJE4_9TELE|nr:leucine rich adaptor protein 1-like [Denticeps clupeoides]
MEEGSANETAPDLKDLEVKIGRKTPEGLLRWMREEAAHHGDAKLNHQEARDHDPEKRSLDEKIRKLRLEMAHLRSVDVRILQQLLAVHEGIEAVKWMLEERSTLTSRCSSLTSSQYSLGEGPDSSWRGSWGSLHDPNDKLDNISIGSYLDTLADDTDEYCPSSSESVLCSTPRTTDTSGRSGAVMGSGPGTGSPHMKQLETTKSSDVTKASFNTSKDKMGQNQAPPSKANGTVDKVLRQDGDQETIRASLADKLAKTQSPKLQKTYKNGKVELDGCNLNGKVHLEYDAHWRWVQSQDDVTFL